MRKFSQKICATNASTSCKVGNGSPIQYASQSNEIMVTLGLIYLSQADMSMSPEGIQWVVT